MAKTDGLSPQERQSQLRAAARKYAKGRMSPEQFEAVERRFGPDYRAGAAAIAWHSLNPVREVRRIVRGTGLA